MVRKISSFLLVFSLAISVFAKNSPRVNVLKSPLGVYVVESFEYKDAQHPQKDYMASRGDFEGMVKAHATFEFKADGSIIQKIGEWVQEYFGELINGTIKMYPCGNMNAKETCIKLSKANRDYSEYKLEERDGKLVLSQSNQTFILKLYLKKVK